MKRTLYRLRMSRQIVGILEKTKNGLRYKSRKFLWWMRGMPRYDEIDEGIGYKDRNGRDIFELDILNVKDVVDNKIKKGVVLWNANKFGILFIDSKEFFPFFLAGIRFFKSEDITITGQLYNNIELIDDLGLDNL
ncbi:MAG: YopX family protein [Bacteroidota bacterium]